MSHIFGPIVQLESALTIVPRFGPGPAGTLGYSRLHSDQELREAANHFRAKRRSKESGVVGSISALIKTSGRDGLTPGQKGLMLSNGCDPGIQSSGP